MTLLSTSNVALYPYVVNRRLEQPYVDKSPGSFSPVGFVVDNSTLKHGQTTYGWRNAERIFFFSQLPWGSVNMVATGLQWVPTKYPGVNQLYWNQSAEDSGSTSSSNGIIACYGLYDVTYSDNLDKLLGGN
jgi:hypothetical protein